MSVITTLRKQARDLYSVSSLFCAKNFFTSTKSRKCSQTAVRNSREDGFAVAAITAIGCMAGLWLLAAANTVYPAYQKAAEFRYWTNVRSAAEAGLDYTVSQLNMAMQNGTTSAFDDPTTDAAPKVTVVPSSVTGSFATVSVSVLNVAPPETSSVWDSQLVADPSGQTPGHPNSNYWRVITSTAQYAGLTSEVRIVLKPTYTGGSEGGSGSSTVPFFNFAIFSQNAFTSSGNMHSDAYDSRNGAYGGGNVNDTKGDVGSNTSVSISGNTIIGGSAVISSLPMSSTTVVVASRSGNAKINNLLETNGISSGFTQTLGDGVSPPINPNDFVKGLGGGVPRPMTVDANGVSIPGDHWTPIDVSQSQAQVSLASAPSAPNGSYNVGAVNISGNGVVIIRNGATPPSSINVSSNNTLVIPPGNYKASSMSVSGNGQIRVESSVSSNTTWTLEGNSAGSNVLSLSGNGIANQTAIPAKFQIYTNSSKNVNISGNANTHAVIYAPSANVSISGNGNFFGSIVAKGASVSGNGMVHFDLALADPNYAQQNGLGYTQASTPALDITGLQTVSWEER